MREIQGEDQAYSACCLKTVQGEKSEIVQASRDSSPPVTMRNTLQGKAGQISEHYRHPSEERRIASTKAHKGLSLAEGGLACLHLTGTDAS